MNGLSKMLAALFVLLGAVSAPADIALRITTDSDANDNGGVDEFVPIPDDGVARTVYIWGRSTPTQESVSEFNFDLNNSGSGLTFSNATIGSPFASVGGSFSEMDLGDLQIGWSRFFGSAKLVPTGSFTLFATVDVGIASGTTPGTDTTIDLAGTLFSLRDDSPSDITTTGTSRDLLSGCGDGLVSGPEECDDGNVVDDDGCTSICEVEDGCVCDGEPSVCVCRPAEAPGPNGRRKNRYISFAPTNAGMSVKLEVRLTSSFPHPGLVGSSWWVQEPVPPGNPLLPAGECVALLGPQATAANIDWVSSGCTVLHVTGCPVEPTSDYDVRAVAGLSVSGPLAVQTCLRPSGGKFWGDTVGDFDGVEWTAPNGTTNIKDAVAVIKTWRLGPVVAPMPGVTIAHLSVVDVEPGDINLVVNFNDVYTVVRSFIADPYPFGPADADGNCP